MTFKRMPRDGSFCVKLISIFLIPTFILSNIAYATPTTDSVTTQSQSITVTNPENIVVPRELGLVKTKFIGKEDRLIIHIQDAHCNYEAQSNIVKILENLHKNYNVNLISVEGADGVIDTSWFKAFPDDEVRKEVADYFMKKGEITGPEFLSITTDYNIKLFGAETRSYYIDNLNAFTSSYPLKEQTEKYLNSIKSALNKLKTYIYSEDLKLMDAKYQDYESKKLAFNDYVKFLQVEAERAKINLRAYENFFKLVSVLVYEKKIDFTVTDKERSSLIDNLSKAISKEALTELVNKSLEFKTGKVSSADYYAYLKALAINNGVDLAKDYPNLYNYIIYNSVYSKIENESLFNDIKKLESGIKEKFFTTDDQRTLEKLSRHIEILIGLVNIKLLNDDYEYFENNKSEFLHEVFSDFIKKKTVQYGLAYEMDDPNDAVAKALPKLEDFYSIAVKRDKALVDNTLGQMNKDKTKVAVLVTGGFHSEGMARLLEKQGVSYMVVCPSITKDLPTPYIQILTNQKTPLADILVTPVHASENQEVGDKGDTLAPPLRTALATMSGKDLDEMLRAIQGGEELRTEVGQVKDNWYPISVNGLHVGSIEIVPGYIERMREGAGGVSSSSVLIAESVMRGLRHNFDVLKIPAADRAKIETSIRQAMDGTLHERMSAEAERKLAQKGRAGPGKNATAPDTTVLNNAQDAAFNEILRHSFDEGTFKIVKASELGITDLGDFQFCVHYGLEARIDKYNKENPSVNLPSDRVCAGRGGARFKHKLSQAHISDYRFNALLMKGDAGTKVLHIIAYHEDAHIKIANGKLVNYLGIDEEDFVDFHVSDASTRTALPQLGGKNVRQVLVDIDKDRMADEAYRMEETLLIDTDYGTTARDEIIRLHGEDKHDEARNFAKEVYMRLHNIDLANTSLTQANYKGYDIMIVSCTTPEEAAYQQKVLEEAFGGVNTSNGYMKNKVCVLAVVDMSEGGQIIGQVVTMLQARKPFKKWAQANGLTDTDIDSYLKNNKARMAIYHNGGKGERFSPGSQGYGNSRGAQPYSNPVAASEGRMIEDANLILGVVRSTNALAMSMPENDYRVDTYWANQTAFGTVDATKVQRSNYLFDKFVVKVPKNPKMKDLFDYGTAVISSTGRIIKFLANRVLTKKDPKSGNYVDNPDYKKERDELLSSPRGSYDYGSFSMSKALHFAMMNYWIDVKHIDKVMGPNMDHKAGISRDIDPAFVQIIVPIMSGLRMKHMLVLPLASHLDAAADKTALLETAYDNILAAMDDEFALAIRKIHDKKKKDPVTGKDTAEIDRASRMTVLETVEMMIRYPDIFADTDRVVGSIDLGANSYWFAFKRILDMANNRLLMLADIIDRNIELEPTGEATSSPSSTDDKLRAEAARRVFGIKNDAVAVFEVNGKIIRLTAKQMKDGWSGDGVEVKRSIIQGKCILLPGSKIVKSFVNNSSGRIVSENSYIETSVAPVITAKNSIIIKVIDTKSVSADKEIVADAYRPAIKDVRFPDGQTRMRAPVGYDPKPVDRELAAKMSDAVKFGDNAYSFQEIREMLCDKADNDRIESGLREKAYTEIHSKVRVSVQVNMTPEWAAAREKYAYSQMSFPMPLLGTSGERGISQKQLTDIRVITMQAGNLSMLADRYNIRPGDAVVFAGDLRPSTPRVAKDAILSTLQQKFNVNWQGYVSTPTVVYWATTNGKPMVSIMITASHNPVRGEKETVADMPSKFENNGLKLNSPTGEILKEDEPWLVEHIKEAELLQFTIPWGEDICGKDGKIKTEGLSAEQRELLGIIDQVMANPGKEAENAYILRNTTEGIGRVFDGEHIGFNEHTGVARDVLPQILRAVGLDVHNYGRSYWEERMDTEDLEPKIEQHMKAEAARLKAEGIDAISHDSTDGDADRPALFDSNGNFIYGDKICGLLCIGLKEDNPQKDFVVVVTATCSEAMVKMLREKYKMKVIKVEVGSPYVVSEMAKQEKLNPGAIVVGFERNTGFFVQTPIVLKNGNTIKKLATRDSAIVIEQVNLLAKKRGMNLEQLVDSEYNGVYESYSWSDGVTNSTPGCEAYTAPVGKAIMRSLAPKDRNMLVIEFDDAGQVYYTNRAAYYGTGTSRILANADVKDRMRRIRNYLSGVFTPAEDFGTIVKMEFIDGVRIFFDNNEIVHLRPSGNEPKWRIYPESPAEKGARARKISDMRLEAYPQMIRDYIAKIGTGAKPVMVPRSVAGIKASLKKLLPSLVIPEDGELKTLNMRFGPETQHLLERGISFAKDDRSFTMYSTRTYNKFAGGQPQSTLQISIIAYPEERRVVYSEIKDGVEVMRAECVGEKAWVELGVGLDKNVPVGKFQDAIFPVMPQETIDKLKNSGVVLLRLLDMTSENEIEPSLWGPEDADVFEFKPVVQAAPLTPALPSLAVATISSSPGKYGVSPDLSQAGSYKADATTIDAQVALAELFDNRPAYQPESELLSAFKIDANDRLKFYRMITNKEDLKKYFALVAQRALDVADPEVSRGLQIMAGQALAIISLIEDKVPGAEKLLLTVNPVDMLRAEDKDRGLSYIDTHSVIDSGIDIADAEGASYGMYWRGAEGVAKLGSNISAEAIYDKEKFDSQSPKMVMYLMLHIGGYHTTVFLHDYLPGSIQHTSTGPGHLQNDSMDIKYVVSGRGIQWNKDDKGGTAYRLERGSWTVAYPYYVDEIVNLGGLVFKDFSFTIPGVAPRTLTAAVPYIAVTVNGQEAFVANRTDKLSISFRAHTSPKEGTISMRDLYGYNNMDRYLNRPLETGSSTRPVVIITPDQVARAAQVVGLTASAAPIPMEPQFNLGSKGYMWGQSVVQSFILAQMGAKTEAERLALAAKFGIAADDQVAERIVASKLGASPITAKVLASAVPLSVQLHTFSEMIVPLEKGKAYLGLKQNMTAEEIIEACMQGRMHEVMNEIELEPGVPMIVPANVPHAYGQVKVYEVKAVTPEEDKNGTVSFFDRLKFLITKPGASLKMTAEELRSQNPGREGKDILTMNEVALAKTRAALEEAQRQGGLNRVEPASLKFEPFVPERSAAAKKPEKAEFEVVGQTDRYITGRYTIDQGGSISASSLNEGEDIPLFVTKGKIEVVNSQGKRYVVNEGENVILAASGGAYELFGLEGPAEVFTQDVPNRRDAESLEMTASEIAAVENKETGQIKYLANTLASKEMKSLITSLDVDDGVIINAFDTTVEDALRGTVQAAQSLINQEAGNRIINIRGTGSALLQAIQKAMTDNQGKVRAVVTTTPDQKIAAAATQYGSVINVEQMRDGRGRYMPVPGLQDLALRIAVANVLYKDGATGGYTRDGARFVFWALDRVALAPDNKPFTIDDVIELLKRGFFRILPRIVPVDLAAASAAYRAAQAALKSL